jgi:hypothetical protein
MPPGNSHRKTRLADRLCQDQNWTIWVPSPSRPTVVAAANLRRYMSPHGPQGTTGVLTLRSDWDSCV